MKSQNVTIEMKVAEHYFPIVLFIMLYKVVLALNLWMKFWRVTIQMKATKQYFPVVLFTMLYEIARVKQALWLVKLSSL